MMKTLTSVWEFLGNWIWLVLSISGTAIVTAVAIGKLIDWPQQAATKALVLIGLVSISLLVSLLINAVTVREMAQRRKAQETHARLLVEVLPSIITGLEQELLQEIDLLKGELVAWKMGEACLRWYVFAEIQGNHRIIASTVESTAQVRRIELEHHEGVVGFAHDQRMSLIANVPNGGEITTRHGARLGEQRPLSASNLAKAYRDVIWILATPIFASSAISPWTNEVLGVLTVDCSMASGGELFLKSDFHERVDAITNRIAPYLSAFDAARRTE